MIDIFKRPSRLEESVTISSFKTYPTGVDMQIKSYVERKTRYGSEDSVDNNVALFVSTGKKNDIFRLSKEELKADKVRCNIKNPKIVYVAFEWVGVSMLRLGTCSKGNLDEVNNSILLTSKNFFNQKNDRPFIRGLYVRDLIEKKASISDLIIMQCPFIKNKNKLSSFDIRANYYDLVMNMKAPQIFTEYVINRFMSADENQINIDYMKKFVFSYLQLKALIEGAEEIYEKKEMADKYPEYYNVLYRNSFKEVDFKALFSDLNYLMAHKAKFAVSDKYWNYLKGEAIGENRYNTATPTIGDLVSSYGGLRSNYITGTVSSNSTSFDVNAYGQISSTTYTSKYVKADIYDGNFRIDNPYRIGLIYGKDSRCNLFTGDVIFHRTCPIRVFFMKNGETQIIVDNSLPSLSTVIAILKRDIEKYNHVLNKMCQYKYGIRSHV